MNEVVQFLNESPIVYFSTIGVDGKPKVRPFQFMLAEEGKVFFCTSNQKDVFSEIEKNKNIELCTMNSKNEWIRINGKVVFSNDMKIKEKVLNSSELVKNIYKSADNKIFEVFYIADAKATIYDFSGNPPRKYTF